MKAAPFVLSVASILVLLPRPLDAQLTVDRVSEVQNMAAWNGWTEMLISPVYRSAPAGGTARVVLELNDDDEYLIAGVCEDPCTDIDLRLLKYDSGLTLRSHTEPGATPFMGPFTVEDNDDYVIETDMVSCGAETCRMAILIFYVLRPCTNWDVDLTACR